MLRIKRKNYCPHCWPARARGHFFDRIEYAVKKVFVFDFADVRLPDQMIISIYKILHKLGVVHFESHPDRTKMKNRSYIFFEEAQNRKIKIWAVKFFNNYTGECVFEFNNKTYRYRGTPLSLLPKKKIDIDDKMRIKLILAKNNLPTPRGKSFWSKSKAYEYGLKLGFPLVVKPNNGSLSRHVATNIQSVEDLEKAIEIARQYQPEVIVEKYLSGKLYRVTVVNQNIVYVCQKRLASVVGDGISTIQKLVDNKNLLEKRTVENQTLKKIFVPAETNPGTVLCEGQKLIIGEKYTLDGGCEIENVKSNVHAKNIEMFLRAAEVLGQPLVGFDFICPDISKSFNEQECGIIEANSFPYLDMHQFPSFGKAESVAPDVLNEVFVYLEHYCR